jgi:hypothetical protein
MSEEQIKGSENGANPAPVHREVLPVWVDLLRHTLGAGKHVRKSKHGYRNRFCASVGSEEHNAFQEMVAAGLAKKGSAINGGELVYYRATVEGCKAIGLSKAATKRAFQE